MRRVRRTTLPRQEAPVTEARLAAPPDDGTVTLAMIQALILLGLRAVADALPEEVRAAAAVDGIIDGNLISHTGFDLNAWWYVDLGSDASICSITLWNRAGYWGYRFNNFAKPAPPQRPTPSLRGSFICA